MNDFIKNFYIPMTALLIGIGLFLLIGGISTYTPLGESEPVWKFKPFYIGVAVAAMTAAVYCYLSGTKSQAQKQKHHKRSKHKGRRH